ncbi:hypothetical protein J6590_014708 [Homalodisca vitripennis]|nr:hypothetical protein J6590_014708 [Homalodisca vitripennis]
MSGRLVDRPLYGCDKCSRMYLNRETLYRHIKYECGKDPQFFCPLCSFRSKRKCNLQNHILRKHYK